MTNSVLRRLLLAVIAAIGAAFVFRRRKPVRAVPPPPPVPAPPVATATDMQKIDALIARENRRNLSAWWLEITAVVVIIILVVTPIAITRRGNSTVVLVNDLRQGDQLDAHDLAVVRLPQLEHAFSDVNEVQNLLAMRNLSGGSVLRTSDVGRPQLVTTANIAAGELLDPAKNFAFKPLSYLRDAVTPPLKSLMQATQFIPAGAVLRNSFVTNVPVKQGDGLSDEMELPLRAFLGALLPAVGTEVIVVATPRAVGPAAAVFEHVRVQSVNSAHDPPVLVVTMKRSEAMRFAALPAADFTLMRTRR